MKKLMALVFLASLALCVPTAIVMSAIHGVWIKPLPNPVLSPGPLGAWDDLGVSTVDVVHDGTTFRMWYGGQTTVGGNGIGYATSPDGKVWETYRLNPVVPQGADFDSWDREISSPSVLFDPADPEYPWKMWYAGLSFLQGGYAIGYAESKDCVTWRKYNDPLTGDAFADSDPVLQPSGVEEDWDSSDVLSPQVILIDGTYHMWYAGQGNRLQIGYATSSDGINWKKYLANPVLRLGAPMEWDGGEIAAPSVHKINGQFQMWYQGKNEQDGKTNIGFASSADGVAWIKDSLNPILEGSPGAWDAFSVFYPSVWPHIDGLHMWYHGQQTANGVLQVGYAFYDVNLQPTPRPTGGTGTPTEPLDPGTYGVSIDEGETYTNQPAVALRLTVPTIATHMMVSNRADFAGAYWQEVNTILNWTLNQEGDLTEPRVVYVRFGNDAGVIVATAQDDILLDMAPPTGSVVIAPAPEAGVLEAGSPVTLTLFAVDDVSGVGHMQVASLSALSGAAWEPYATEKIWTMGLDGTVYVRFRDLAGNVSPPYSASLPGEEPKGSFMPIVRR